LMSKETHNLFKFSKPVIRPFEAPGDTAGDMPVVWDAYKKGTFKDMPTDLTMEEFLNFSLEMQREIAEMWIVEDKIGEDVVPIALIVCKNDGWVLEPHVQYFDNATPKTILRSYAGFMKKTKYRKDIGACLVRVEKNTLNLVNRIEKMGLLEYVGKIWGGRPSGNEYLYSVRCGRKNPPIMGESNMRH